MTDTSKDLAPTYEVLIGGAVLDQAAQNNVKEIRVSSYLQLPDSCILQLAFPRLKDDEGIPYRIGDEVEVRLGATDDETNVPVALFKGQITTLEPEFGAGGIALTIRAYDRSQLLYRSRKSRAFQDQTSSDIVKKLVAEVGLTAQCDASGEPHEFMQQDNETDWDFIWRLADRIGFEFVVEDTTAHFRKPTAEGAVELKWPETLRSFRPRVTAVQQVKKVTLAVHDPKTKQAIKAEVTTPNQVAEIGLTRDSVTRALPDSDIHVATEPVKSQDEANGLAQALLDKLANGYVAAEGVAPGNPKIKAGAKVKVDGIAKDFKGTYRVAYATHILKVGGYETHFANSPSHTLLGTINGTSGGGSPSFAGQLVIGVVTNNQDPDKMGRVRVRYPALSDELEGAWARIATPSAGNARGLLMLPVVGEEVLIGFEHDDTTRPYVLGSLFNGTDQPGDNLLLDNDGSFGLQSDHKIYQESKEDFTIKSGGKLVVQVQGDVEETVSGNWKNDTTGKIDLTATQPMTLQGQNVTITGQSQVSISGNSSISISCGASSISISPSGVTISGPMVSIG
jgi:uncharacterized protein involved in type VI secretion and phage assembly